MMADVCNSNIDGIAQFVISRLESFYKHPHVWGGQESIETQMLFALEVFHMTNGRTDDYRDQTIDRFNSHIGGGPLPLSRRGLNMDQFCSNIRTFILSEIESNYCSSSNNQCNEMQHFANDLAND